MSMKKMVMVSLTSVLVLTQLADVTTAVAIEAEKKPEKTEVVVPKSPAKEQVVQEKKELVPPVTEQIQKPVTVPTQETQVQSEAKAVIKEEKKVETSVETVEASKAQTIKKSDVKKEDKKLQAQKASERMKYASIYVKYMVYNPGMNTYFQDGPSVGVGGFIGDIVDLPAPSDPNLEYEKGPKTAVITEGRPEIEVFYRMKEVIPMGGQIHVRYLDEKNNTINNDLFIADYVGKPYNVYVEEIKGYDYIGSEGAPLVGVFDRDRKDIILRYKKDKSIARPVDVTYYDIETGDYVKPSLELNGKIGEDYTVDIPEIEGYVYVKHDGELTGKFSDKHQSVSIDYKKSTNPVKEAKPVTVKYKDENGKEIRPSETLTGKLGESFKAEKVSIKGYSFKESDKPLSGELTSVAQTINVVYSKDKEPVKEAKPVTVNYVDTKGKTIAKSETLTGKVGDKFNASIKTIKGYTFKESDKPLSGELTTVAQTINVIYNKDKAPEVKAEPVTINYVDEAGKVISEPKVLTGEINKQFKIPTPLIKGYVYKSSDKPLVGSFTTTAQSITLTYAKESKPVETSKPVTVNYVDEAGKVISEAKVLTGKLNDDYKVEVPKIKGYLYKSSDKSLTGKFTTNSQSITLTYNKDKTIVNKKTYVNKNNVVTKNKRKELPKTNEASNLYELIGFSLLGVLAMIKRRIK